MIGAAAYQAHVQWSNIKHAFSAVDEVIDAAVRDKIITTDRRVQDKVRKELAPMLKRIEQLERVCRRAAGCACQSNAQP